MTHSFPTRLVSDLLAEEYLIDVLEALVLGGKPVVLLITDTKNMSGESVGILESLRAGRAWLHELLQRAQISQLLAKEHSHLVTVADKCEFLAKTIATQIGIAHV